MIDLVEIQVKEGRHPQQLEHERMASFDYVDRYHCHYIDPRHSNSRNSLAEKPQYPVFDAVESTGCHPVSSDPTVETLVEAGNDLEYVASYSCVDVAYESNVDLDSAWECA